MNSASLCALAVAETYQLAAADNPHAAAKSA
jgi:hypothetical protein